MIPNSMETLLRLLWERTITGQSDWVELEQEGVFRWEFGEYSVYFSKTDEGSLRFIIDDTYGEIVTAAEVEVGEPSYDDLNKAYKYLCTEKSREAIAVASILSELQSDGLFQG